MNPVLGYANAGPQPTSQPVLIEATSKAWKLHLAVSTITSLAGSIMFCAGALTKTHELTVGGGVLTGVGIIYHAIVRIRAWWAHG